MSLRIHDEFQQVSPGRGYRGLGAVKRRRDTGLAMEVLPVKTAQNQRSVMMSEGAVLTSNKLGLWDAI